MSNTWLRSLESFVNRSWYSCKAEDYLIQAWKVADGDIYDASIRLVITEMAPLPLF